MDRWKVPKKWTSLWECSRGAPQSKILLSVSVDFLVEDLSGWFLVFPMDVPRVIPGPSINFFSDWTTKEKLIWHDKKPLDHIAFNQKLWFCRTLDRDPTFWNHQCHQSQPHKKAAKTCKPYEPARFHHQSVEFPAFFRFSAWILLCQPMNCFGEGLQQGNSLLKVRISQPG